MKRSFCFVAILFLTASAMAQTASVSPSKPQHNLSVDSQSEAASFAGCYELQLGHWWPFGFGAEAKYVTPPTRIELIPEKGTQGFEQNGFLIRPISNGKGPIASRGAPSYWQVKSSSELALMWTDGFTGVTLSLKKHGNELSGWAHPHFDSPHLIPRIEHVTAEQIACAASSATN